MSNAAAVIGLTFGGSDVQNGTFGIFLEIRSGLVGGVSVRGTDTIVPTFQEVSVELESVVPDWS
jgi:hypothetical protein